MTSWKLRLVSWLSSCRILQVLLSADKTTVQAVCFYENRERLLESYFSFETVSDPLEIEIGHAFREAYAKERKFFCR